MEDNGKSSNALLPPHIHKDSMHEITEEESPQPSHARLRIPQSFTPHPVNNLTPVLRFTKQSIPNHKHGPLIRPKLHDTNTNTNRPGAPAITLTNGESSSPKHESHSHATLSPSRPLTPPGLPQPPNELPFHRNLEQRGSDICLYSNPSMDVGCLESDDPNSQLASSDRKSVV